MADASWWTEEAAAVRRVHPLNRDMWEDINTMIKQHHRLKTGVEVDIAGRARVLSSLFSVIQDYYRENERDYTIESYKQMHGPKIECKCTPSAHTPEPRECKDSDCLSNRTYWLLIHRCAINEYEHAEGKEDEYAVLLRHLSWASRGGRCESPEERNHFWQEPEAGDANLPFKDLVEKYSCIWHADWD